MRRPSYRNAIAWMVLNDETTWAESDDDPGSVVAALVADMFGVDDQKVRLDIRNVRHAREVGKQAALK